MKRYYHEKNQTGVKSSGSKEKIRKGQVTSPVSRAAKYGLVLELELELDYFILKQGFTILKYYLLLPLMVERHWFDSLRFVTFIFNFQLSL